MPTAQSILTHSPDLAPIEAVTTPVDADVVVVGIAADAGAGEDAAPVVVAPGLEGEATAALAAVARSVGASTKVASTTRVPAPDGVSAGSVVLVGLGSSDDKVSDESLRRAADAAARARRGLGSAMVLLDTERAKPV
ncbi:MAG: M17 family peptidase N-terminal domain-containing protein, partial [Dietzia maris]